MSFVKLTAFKNVFLLVVSVKLNNVKYKLEFESYSLFNSYESPDISIYTVSFALRFIISVIEFIKLLVFVSWCLKFNVYVPLSSVNSRIFWCDCEYSTSTYGVFNIIGKLFEIIWLSAVSFKLISRVFVPKSVWYNVNPTINEDWYVDTACKEDVNEPL